MKIIKKTILMPSLIFYMSFAMANDCKETKTPQGICGHSDCGVLDNAVRSEVLLGTITVSKNICSSGKARKYEKRVSGDYSCLTKYKVTYTSATGCKCPADNEVCDSPRVAQGWMTFVEGTRQECI